RLLIAPRHPERFSEVAELISHCGFPYIRRSGVQAASAEAQTSPVILLDTIGELAFTYRFADIVFVGGSLVAKGGHNIIEPALYARPIIVGPYTDNFRQIIADFASADALAQVEATEFAGRLTQLLEDGEVAQAMGERAATI